ncbi:MAG: hypothetical protein ACHQ49_05565 [Elusimicrobiota bacterium]
MRIHLHPAAAPLMLLFFSTACRTGAPFDAPQRAGLAEKIISGWAAPSRLAAAKTIDQYGPPDALSESALGWKRRGVWKRIVVRNGEGAGGRADLEVTVACRTPETRRRALEAFDKGVRLSADAGELSARSTGESLDILALNLADEILRGARDPGDASEVYDRTVELAASGLSSPYMKTLLFPTGEQRPSEP